MPFQHHLVLPGVLLEQEDLSGLDFRYADLRASTIMECNMHEADLRGADLNFASVVHQSVAPCGRCPNRPFPGSILWLTRKDDRAGNERNLSAPEG
jgi:hypothetical protein